VGTRKLMRDNLIATSPYEKKLSKLEKNGKTAMLMSVGGKIAALVAVADTVKDHAAEAIQRLQDQGVDVYMLTGDNKRTAEAIGKQVGIKKIIAEVLPEDKANKVKELQLQGKKVAMVGDGINDAPA